LLDGLVINARTQICQEFAPIFLDFFEEIKAARDEIDAKEAALYKNNSDSSSVASESSESVQQSDLSKPDNADKP